MTATKTSVRLARRLLYWRLICIWSGRAVKRKFDVERSFLQNILMWVSKKETKHTQKHTHTQNGTCNWCRSPSSLFRTLSHCSVFLFSPGRNWLGTHGFIQYERKECRVSAPRRGFMFGITRSLFTARSPRAYTRTNLWRSGVGSSSLLMTAPRWPLQRKQMEPQGDVSISLTTWVSQGKEQM